MLAASIAVSPDLRAALAGLKPQALLKIVARGMAVGVKKIEAGVTKRHLTGQGPFAVAAHRLGNVSGELRKRTYSTVPEMEGSTVKSSIGASGISYAHAHEFGFAGKVKVPPHQRTITMAFGKKLDAPKTFTVRAHQRSVKIPERMPFRAGVKAHLHLLESALASAVQKSFRRS